MSKKVKYKNKAWFCYNGVGDPYHAASYRQVAVKPEGPVGAKVCAIYATGHFTPISPLSANVQSYISLALVSGLSQPPISSKSSKCFVYLKA